MDISLDKAPKHNITYYCTDRIDVDNIPYSESLILTPEKMIEKLAIATFAAIQLTDLEPLIQLKPEIVILGTGQQQRFPDATIRLFFWQHHIGLEVMETGAACRTYNILASEGRRVAAMLLLDNK